MLNIPKYQKYNGEKRIAVMDNSLMEFLHIIAQKNINVEKILADYDLLLIPEWVLTELNDSEFRKEYIQNLIDAGFPFFSVSETDYTDFVHREEGNLYEIILASVKCISELQGYLRRNVQRSDPFDMEPYREWITKLYQDWPLQNGTTSSGRILKKNAGEISITILTEIFSFYYSDLERITVFSHDADTYDYVTKAHDQLLKSLLNRSPISVAYKSIDSILCQLFRSGILKDWQIIELRPNPRFLRYVRLLSDGAVAPVYEKVDSLRFIELIQDMSLYIIF